MAHPSAELYGSDRMLAESVAGLAAAGAEVLVALPAPGPLVPLLEAAGARVRITRVPVLRKSALRPSGAARLAVEGVAGLARAVRLLRARRPSVLYVSTQVLPVWVLAGALARVPVVVHVHEAESAAPAPVRRALAAPLLLAREVLVNSVFAADVLVGALPRLRGRPRLVPNGVEGPPTAPAERPTAGPVRLLYVGRLSERKGVLVAVDALAELVGRGVDATLDLVGDVFVEHAGFGAVLDAALARPAVEGRVVRHGFVADVWPHLAAADVLLVPSLLPEPFGNTAVEGVLAARAVVASGTGGLPEALAGCVAARLVPPGDAVALADAVADLLADRAGTAAAARHDAALLHHRHAPARYRREVAGAVLAAAGHGVPAQKASR